MALLKTFQHNEILQIFPVLFLLVFLLKVLYFRKYFGKEDGWFQKTLKPDFFGEMREGQNFSTSFFSFLQLYLALNYLGLILLFHFSIDSSFVSCVCFTPFLIISGVSVITTKIKNQLSYPWAFYSNGKLLKIVSLFPDQIFFWKDKLPVGIREDIDQMANWSGSYWVGVLINEQMVTYREVLFVLPEKNKFSKKDLRIFNHIFNYASERNVCSSIVSPIRIKRKHTIQFRTRKGE